LCFFQASARMPDARCWKTLEASGMVPVEVGDDDMLNTAGRDTLALKNIDQVRPFVVAH